MGEAKDCDKRNQETQEGKNDLSASHRRCYASLHGEGATVDGQVARRIAKASGSGQELPLWEQQLVAELSGGLTLCLIAVVIPVQAIVSLSISHAIPSSGSLRGSCSTA